MVGRRLATALVLVGLALVALLTAIPQAARAFTPAEGKAPMTVTLVRSDAADCGADCPEWIAMTGQIVAETPARLVAVLAKVGKRHLPVLVDSPGGHVEAALAMGRMIRARKLDVAVGGTALTDCAPDDKACLQRLRTGERAGFVAAGPSACASACVFLLAAGTERAVGRESYVGVHQIITKQTVTRVMNMFRIQRRLVNGRAVEVSRTLVSRRPLSSRIVTGSATPAMYSEVDRYLLGMGIAESIMPLMRATPPSGMHWMTPAEVTETRIATDRTDAQTWVAGKFNGHPAPASSPPPQAGVIYGPEEASLAIGDNPTEEGTISWQMDGTHPHTSIAVGQIEIPDHDLRATVSIAGPRNAMTAAPLAVRAKIEIKPDRKLLTITSVGAPRLCHAVNCDGTVVTGIVRQSAASNYVFEVAPTDGYTFLSMLREKTWFSLPVVFSDGSSGELGFSLSDDSRAALAEWGYECCSIGKPTAPRSRREATQARPLSPAPLVTAAVPSEHFTPHSIDLSTRFTLTLPWLKTPFDGFVPVTWIPIASMTSISPSGSATLLGTVDIPAADLRLSIEAGPARPGQTGRLIVVIHPLAADREIFGPIATLRMSTKLDAAGAPLLLPEASYLEGSGGAVATLVDVPESGPMPDEIPIEIDDVLCRRLTITLPLNTETAAVLQAAARTSTRTGS